MKQVLNEAVKKVTLDELNYILMNVSDSETIIIEAFSSSGLKKGGLDAEGNKIVNEFYNTDKLMKKSITYGKIQFSYESEVKDRTGEQDFKASRSMGQKVGALVINTKGNVVLPMAYCETTDTKYVLNGKELTPEEVATLVTPFKTPYKPSQSDSTAAKADLNMRTFMVKNILKITVGNDEYHISNPNGTLKS